jgi:hypothetical protein
VRALGAQRSVGTAGTRRNSTSLGNLAVHFLRKGSRSKQCEQPYQKNSTTSIFSPVSTACGLASGL